MIRGKLPYSRFISLIRTSYSNSANIAYLKLARKWSVRIILTASSDANQKVKWALREQLAHLCLWEHRFRERCHAQSHHAQLCRVGILHQWMTVILTVRLPVISIRFLLPDREANPRHNSTAFQTLRNITYLALAFWAPSNICHWPTSVITVFKQRGPSRRVFCRSTWNTVVFICTFSF